MKTSKRNGTKQNVEVSDFANLGHPLTKLQKANEIMMEAYNLMAELKDKIILFP